MTLYFSFYLKNCALVPRKLSKPSGWPPQEHNVKHKLNRMTSKKKRSHKVGSEAGKKRGEEDQTIL